ncbi:MAG: Ig domain-containing protein [Chthoniobacterales bacterium]
MQIVYGADDKITSFHATFVQHCEGMGPALHGEILYNSSAALPPKNHLTSPLTAYGTRYQPFQYNIRASNSPTSFTANNLPAGLVLDANSGVISGTPSIQGTFTIPLTATGISGVASGTLSLILDPPGQSTGPYTALYLESDSGDFVGQGMISLFRSVDGYFSVYRSGISSVNFGFTTPDYTDYWSVNLSSPTGSSIGAGTYFGATRSASSANPGLDVSGDSRGCNMSSGFFVVKELVSVNDTVTSMDATFVQHCEDMDPALRGELWYNSNNAITSDPFSIADRDAAFSYQIIGNNLPTSYTATPLPAGLAFAPATGVISGTPAIGGSFSVAITAKGPTSTAAGRLSLTIVPPDRDNAPVISSPRAASATIQQSFTYQIMASHAATQYSVSGLPAGLSLDTTTGLISGTPTVAGTFNVLVMASNASGTGGSSLILSVYPPIPVITSAKQATALAGKPFTFQTTASNQPASYSASGLPDDLTIDSITGLITGTPVNTGTYIVTLRAGNGSGVGYQIFTLTVNVAKPTITSALTASATENQSFYYQITADGNATSFGASGLPDGVTVTSSGYIAGMPTRAGTYNIEISATNSAGTGTATLVLTVVAKPGELLNISTRLQVGTGENVLIAGFILTDGMPKRLLIRGLGPSLVTQGVANALPDPVLELHDSATGAIIATNDNWKDTQEAAITDTGIPPTDDRSHP